VKFDAEKHNIKTHKGVHRQDEDWLERVAILCAKYPWLVVGICIVIILL